MTSRGRSKDRRTRTGTSAVSFRPEQFPLGSPQSRAAVRALLLQNQKRLQFFFFCPELPLNLEKSKCVRYTISDGTLIEVIQFDGNADELTDTELEEFILRHPINSECERNTHVQSKE